VSTELSLEAVVVFQKWMCLSHDPPPVANKLSCQGHQARAYGGLAATWDRTTLRVTLTAAV
jgi:hypothetical protein